MRLVYLDVTSFPAVFACKLEEQEKQGYVCMHLSSTEKRKKMLTNLCKECITPFCMECFKEYQTIKNIMLYTHSIYFSFLFIFIIKELKYHFVFFVCN